MVQSRNVDFEDLFKVIRQVRPFYDDSAGVEKSQNTERIQGKAFSLERMLVDNIRKLGQHSLIRLVEPIHQSLFNGRKLGSRFCEWVECACIHHTAYPMASSSRSGHQSPNSRNTDTAKFPVGICIKGQSTSSEGGLRMPYLFCLGIDVQNQLPIYQ